ncbi:UDP-glucose 4-epimerase-like [Styela clava]
MGSDKEQGVLVTGGAGFIGSHTVVELLERNVPVIVIDNMTNATASKDEEELPPVLQRIKKIVNPQQGEKLHFIKGSFGDVELLEKIFTKYAISAVIHFGGFKAVGESKELPMMYYSNNVGGTLKLIQSMQKHNVTNMIFSSSATVYSAPGPDDLPLSEKSLTGSCTCPYASTKFFIENILRDLCYADKNWTVISLRYFNPVGAHASGEIGEDPKGIPNNLMPFIAQVAVKRREHLNIYGNDYQTKDGTGVRDYVHVVDLAKGHTAALDVLPKKNGFHTYNLGTGIGTSVLEMLKYFGEVVGRELPYKICDRRPGDLAVMYCDASLAEKELGWTATKSVKEMCEDLWKFQSKNPNGYLP